MCLVCAPREQTVPIGEASVPYWQALRLVVFVVDELAEFSLGVEQARDRPAVRERAARIRSRAVVSGACVLRAPRRK